MFLTSILLLQLVMIMVTKMSSINVSNCSRSAAIFNKSHLVLRALSKIGYNLYAESPNLTNKQETQRTMKFTLNMVCN